jgi:MFS family permease
MSTEPAGTGAGRLPPVLRHPDFVRYMVGRFCTSIGWQMLTVAVGWQVYSLTHDPLSLGLVGLCEFLPFFALILIGGHVADRVDRQKIVAVAALIESVCVAALLWFSVSGVNRPWPIYVAVAIFGATHAFWAPATQAYVVNLVPRAQLTSAIATSTSLRQIAEISGPALGGIIYLLGAPVVYATCMLLFLLTSALTFHIKTPSWTQRTAGGALGGRIHELFEGLRFVLHNRTLLGMISLDLFAVLFGGAVALLPIYAADILHTGTVGLGMLRTAPAVGAAIVGATLAIRPLRNHAGAWMFGGVTVFGLATIVFGLSTSFLLSLAALLLAGAGDMLSIYVRLILVQTHTPEHIRGRVSAVNSMFVGASNELGAFESGVMARLFGTVPSVLIGGCATLAIVGVWAWLFPQLRKVSHLTRP